MNSNKISFPLQVNTDLCTACGICAETCAFQAIQMNDGPEINPQACRLCGSCVQNCPSEALSIQENTETQTEEQQTAAEIWVLAEHSQGQIAAVTYELLGIARRLADQSGMRVAAMLLGHQLEPMTADLIAYGADTVHLVDRVGLETFIEENHARVACDLIRECKPAALLVGATVCGRGLSARLAALLHTGLTADCTELRMDTESGLLQQVRPAFGGNLMATIVTPHHRPQMASVRPGVMQAQEPDRMRSGEVIRHEDYTFCPDERISVIHEEDEGCQTASLSQSRVIIGIGRGVKSKETVAEIEAWAERIGAAVAGSRAAVEANLIDASRQVGQTGHTIAPDLYVAIGISGQIQHTAAITGAKRIIAINPDSNAPIFRIADYGWVAPVEEALPKMMQTLNELGV